MRLANLNEYRRLVFTEDSAPTVATLRQQIRDEKLPGGCIVAGRYYVDLDELDRRTALTANLQARKAELERSPRLKGLI